MQTWNDLASIDEEKNNLLILDGNNLAYRWIGRHNYDNFTEDYISTIKSLAGSYHAKRIIVAFDFGKSYYRVELLDTYKAGRKKPTTPEETQKYDDFFKCLNETIEELPMESYKFRGVEADDIIAYLTTHLAENYEHIWIVSSDTDLHQLITENVSIFNLYSRKEITEDSLLEDKGLSPSEVLLAKIIAGDSGDNITGVEGIGAKRSADLARKYKDLPGLIAARPIKGTAKYIKNLNASDTTKMLVLNNKLINLHKYHETAITAGKNGEEYLEELSRALRL
jgi:DNA polymerase I